MKKNTKSLTRRQAIDLSITKWECIVKEEGDFNGFLLPGHMSRELSHLINYCGLCEKYIHTTTNMLDNCGKCPFRPKFKDYNDIDSIGCNQRNHLFQLWSKYDEHKLKYAKMMLDALITLRDNPKELNVVLENEL